MDQFSEDVRSVALEANRKLDRDDDVETPREAVATAVGDVIPNERGGEDYKANLLVRATEVLQDAIDDVEEGSA